MLIDELLSNPVLARSNSFSVDLRGRMSKAPKFVLERDFAVAADELSNDVAGINKALPLCRLPFRECWFESAQTDRCSWRAALPTAPELAVKRVGFFIKEIDPAGSWSAEAFWSWAAGTAQDWSSLPGLSPLTIEFNYGRAAAGYQAAFGFSRASWVTDDFTLADLVTAAPNLKLRDGNAEQKLTGEALFLAAMLALLNSRNVTEVEAVDLSNKNKRRKLQGKVPLFSYHWLRIPARYKRRHIRAEGTPTGIELRAHFVRGHFKIRKTGVFFWSSYQRGNPALGFMHKDYVLTAEAA
jgi:hypothetical protein